MLCENNGERNAQKFVLISKNIAEDSEKAMIRLLLVAPCSKQSQGGMTVWTETFLSQCAQRNDVECDLLNIATIGSRAVQLNSRRHFKDEFARTKAIFKNLKKKMACQTYDAAHINTSCGAFGLIRDYILARKIKRKQPACKRIVHFHCDVQKQTAQKYKKYFLKKLLKITDTALVLNQKNKTFLEKISSVSVAAVPNFIDAALIRTEKKKISHTVEKAVFVGFVQPQKGASEIYELAKAFPTVTFNLIGAVRADVAEWEKPENVILHGPKTRSEIIEALDDADVFIFPTHSEGFSVALLECMARGVPSVTTDVGANLEMLENKGGIVVPVGDVFAMRDAMLHMFEPAKREEMSDWSIQKVCLHYSVTEVVSRMIDFYK